MQRTLFLGNGVNRLTNSGVGWDDVLNDLPKGIDDENLLRYKDVVPFTLIFEGFSSKNLLNSQRGKTPLKKRVADLLNRMTFNPYHEQIMNLGIAHIITTNYDYSLEKSASTSVYKYFRNETRYSVFRRTKIANTNIWHIHGEIDKPETITIGHEQYSGQLENLRKHLTSKKSSPFRMGRENFENFNKKYSWGDVFLRDEVHIVGFSLDYSEIDIWWLLTFKAQYEARYNIKCGPTIFYYWSSESKKKRDKGKINLLKSLNVEVKEIFSGDYKVMYNDFIANFK